MIKKNRNSKIICWNSDYFQFFSKAITQMKNELLPSSINQDPIKGKSKSFKSYTRYVLDPFQIFCIEKRNDFILEHPQLKSSEITSALSQIWRNMSLEEKQTYNTLAMSLQNNRISVKKKKKMIDLTNINTKKEKIFLSETSEPDIFLEKKKSFSIPKIYVIKRNDFNVEISAISKNVLKEHDNKIIHNL